MNYPHDHSAHTGFPHDFHIDPLSSNQPPYQHDFESSSISDPNRSTYSISNPQSAHKMSCEVKPRLTKEQHDILEAHYQKQQKPNTSTKKGFAESLNVSLEKVNNWFQNRRAKSKQDAKKHQGTVNLFNSHQQNMSASDSDASPAFPSPDYLNLMQQQYAAAEDSLSSSLDMTSYNQATDDSGVQIPNMAMLTANGHLNVMQSMHNDMFNDPNDLNRRTMTQEQFDAFAHQDSVLDPSDFALLHADPDAFSKMLADISGTGFKLNSAFDFSQAMPASMPSDESRGTSTASDHSLTSFPPSNGVMPDHSVPTALSESDWTGSRGSSVSLAQHEDSLNLPMSIQAQSSAGTANQWQPGQSVPVDYNQMNEEFQRAALARQQPQIQPQQHQSSHEQPLAWPMDEAFQRRDSQTSLITQYMGNVGLHTPQAQQHATFHSPTPSSSLAARRQRQRPAPLGLASLRSQSYSSLPQPGGSPNHVQPTNLGPSQHLRRIKSSNVLGGVAPGRVQKSIALPQRSPLSWTFTDAMQTPRNQGTQSSTILAPPTPLSPGEQSRLEPLRQMQQHWQSSSGHVSRQASISETDAEHGVLFAPPPPPPNFSSPPHSPEYHGQPRFTQPMINRNVITENTPPQSAPASQQCFPANIFAPAPPHPMQQQQQVVTQPSSNHHLMQFNSMQHQHQQQQQQPPPPQQPAQQVQQSQLINTLSPEQQYHQLNGSLPANPHFTITTSGPPIDMPMQFAQNGLPIVDAQGQMQVAMPSQLQFVQQKVSQSLPQQQHQSKQTFMPEDDPNVIRVTAQVPRHSSQTSSEFFVHEYTPPQDVKRISTPRKPVDSGPKNYTFANHGPEHFEKGKKSDTKSSTTGTSPASATSL